MATSVSSTPTVKGTPRKLRVLFLATRDWYNPATTGGDNTMWENARYLAARGHEVTFVAARHPGAAREETIDGLTVMRLGSVHTLWLTTFLRYMSRWRGRFDVVVAEGFGGSRVPRLAPLYVREPVLTEWHQVHRDLFAIQYPKLMNGPLNLLERISAWVSRGTLVRAGTPEWQEAFGRIGFKPDHVFVLPVSIRDEWLRQPPSAASSRPAILWLGKLRRYKCPDHAIRALPAVLARIPDAELTIAGRSDDARYAAELGGLAERLGVAAHVGFRWNLTEAEKLELIRSSRVLVVTSAVEGFGIVVLEANACGVPVVASTGVPEGAVRDRYNGLRYRFGDTDSLAKALTTLLTDPPLHEQLSENGRAFARQFAWSDIGAQYEQVVQGVAHQAVPQ